jgi:hypothetical protein
MQNPDALCPSSRASTEARLLGIRNTEGMISILPVPLETGDGFLEQLPEGVIAEQQFRFVGKCHESGCRQWTKKGCGVALRALEFLDQLREEDVLPPCSIRNNCRWYKQEGAQLCRICPYIITEITAEEIDGYFTERFQHKQLHTPNTNHQPFKSSL